MSGPPEVSIVIPTHNRALMLPDAVSSALRERTVEVEVLVVDDASHDGTAAWLENQTDPRLRHWSLDPGRGGSGARNRGLEETRGEMVLFLDDDDILRPQAIELLSGALRDNPDADRAMGAYCTFGEGVRPVRALHPRRRLKRPLWREELFGWNGPPAAIMWRTSVVREIGGWNETLRRAEDTDVNLRSWRSKVVVLPDVVLDYRYHRTQVTLAEFWPIDRRARLEFIARLPEREQAEAQRILHAREEFQTGMEHYSAQEFRPALAQFSRVARELPSMFASPVLGPWLTSMVAKTALLAASPKPLARQAALRRRARKGFIPDGRRAPEDRPASNARDTR